MEFREIKAMVFGGIEVLPPDFGTARDESEWKSCRSGLFVSSAGLTGRIFGESTKSPDPLLGHFEVKLRGASCLVDRSERARKLDQVLPDAAVPRRP